MPTATVYCTPADVGRFLLQNTRGLFTTNSNPSDPIISNYIIAAEGELQQAGAAWKPVLETHEIHDLQGWRRRHRDIFADNWFAVPRPVQLNNRPVCPLDTNRGHKIELYETSSGTINTANPEGSWTDYLVTGTAGRENDYWLDEMRGTLSVRKTFLFRRAALFRITYEWGKPIYTTSSAVAIGDTTISMNATHRIPTRGFVRIDEEWIHHTGKTSTTLTGCTRGMRGTQAEAHNSGEEVYDVPDDVWAGTVMRAAALYLSNERFIATSGDGNLTSNPLSASIQEWNAAFARLKARNQRWTLI